MAVDWINGRATVLLGEAWEHAILLQSVSEKAEELRAEPPSLWTDEGARALALAEKKAKNPKAEILPLWTDEDVSALALEILFSEAGLNGDLVFVGVGPSGQRASIPATYFNPMLRGKYTLHRGFNPDLNTISFAPLHDVQDEAFDAAARQAMTFPELYHDWEEVEVVADKLAVFLGTPSLQAGPQKHAQTSEGKRGRKPGYAWPEFVAEAIRKLEYEGGISAVADPGPEGFIQANLERHMADWCQRNWGRVPGERSVRDHVREAIGQYDEGKKGRN